MNSYFAIKRLAQSEAKAFGLDTSETYVEKIPLVVKPVGNIVLKRVDVEYAQREDAVLRSPAQVDKG